MANLLKFLMLMVGKLRNEESDCGEVSFCKVGWGVILPVWLLLHNMMHNHTSTAYIDMKLLNVWYIPCEYVAANFILRQRGKKI